jgi:hypothetical protein
MGRLIDEFNAARNGLLPAREIVNRVVPAAAVPKTSAIARYSDDQSELCYQHSFFCQMRLPYRNPEGIATWTRHQGNRILTIEAGHKTDPVTGEDIQAEIPWGTKARLILAHLHGEALRQGSPEIAPLCRRRGLFCPGVRGIRKTLVRTAQPTETHDQTGVQPTTAGVLVPCRAA